MMERDDGKLVLSVRKLDKEEVFGCFSYSLVLCCVDFGQSK